MKDTYKAILALTLVPLLVEFGFSEACGGEISSVVATVLTALSLVAWKWTKK